MRASDLMQAGRYAESVVAARAALELAAEAGATGDEIRATIILGVGLSFAGDPDSGVMTIESARARALREGSSEEVVAAHVNLAFVLLGDGQMERAARGGARRAGRGNPSRRRRVRRRDPGRQRSRGADPNRPAGPRRPRSSGMASTTTRRRHSPASSSSTGAELDVLRGRLPEAEAALEAIAARGLMDDFQFQQQVRAVEG